MTAVADIAEEVAAGADIRRRYLIKGQRGSGRSAALDGVAKSLAADSALTPIVLRPGNGPDAAAVLMTSSAAGLESAEALDAAILERLRIPEDQAGADFDRKLADFATALDQASSSVVLLCDGPARWAPQEFAERVGAVTETIFSIASLRIVFTMPSPFKTRLGNAWDARAADANAEILHHLESTSLASAANAVAAFDEIAIDDVPPLALRLLVALECFEAPPSSARRATLSKTPESLAALLLAELIARESPLAETWMGLFLARRPFTERLVRRLAPAELTQVESDVLTNCLLYDGVEGYWLHDALRGPASSRLAVEVRQSAHRLLATYYEEAFSDVPDASAKRLQLELEAFHHAASSGEAVLDQFRPIFLDQLADLGRQLSEVGEYAEAADVFERATRWAPDEPYVQHYHAYNRDVIAGDIRKIEASYRRAVEIEETHPWWHSRFVRFLITVGRVDEAREAWRAAVACLGAGPSSEPRLFDELHAEVAALLLHRAHLDFASEVLQTIPSAVRRNIPRFVALDCKYGALREARDWGAFIPAEYWDEEWWSDGPRLLAPTIGSGRRRKQRLAWYPGRVVNRAGRVSTIEMALLHEEDPASGRPTTTTIDITDDRLVAMSLGGVEVDLDIDDFVEVGYYGADDPLMRVARFERRPFIDPRLSPIFPPPDRFIGRA